MLYYNDALFCSHCAGTQLTRLLSGVKCSCGSLTPYEYFDELRRQREVKKNNEHRLERHPINPYEIFE